MTLMKVKVTGLGFEMLHMKWYMKKDYSHNKKN